MNQEETLAAREKQKRIKEAFRSWVFADPERTERLVRVYNDTYNNLRLRVFDGSHLEFPGMNRTISLHPHQKDAIWRGMSRRQHAPGPRRRGREDLHDGRHRHEAEGRRGSRGSRSTSSRTTCSSSSPASSSSSTRTRSCSSPRRTTSPATGGRCSRRRSRAREWDGIIITHSSFERIGMSAGLPGEVPPGANRRVRRAPRRQRPRRLEPGPPEHHQDHREAEGQPRGAAEGPPRRGQEGRRPGLRRAGRRLPLHRRGPLLQEPRDADQDGAGGGHPDGRERAGVRPLHEGPLPGRAARGARGHVRDRHADLEHDGRDVHDAAVPRPEGARRTAASSTSTAGPRRSARSSTRWRSAPDGATLRPRSRFAKFVNLPELQQMFRAFADVQTAAMLDLPTAPPLGRQADVVAVPDVGGATRHPGAARRPLRADPLAEGGPAGGQRPGHHDRRAEARPRRPAHLGRGCPSLPSRRPTPWSSGSRTSGDGRRRFAGTQLVFCDLGVNPTPWGYSVYDEVIAKLVAARHPPVADRRRRRRRRRTRRSRPSSSGCGRARSGCSSASTQKMGTGANVQRRLVCPPSPRRPVEAGRGRAAGGPNPPAGERERGGLHLPVRDRGVVRRLHVAGVGDQGPVHRPGDDGRERGPAGRGHRRPGAVVCRGEGHRLGEPGGPDARRGRRRAPAALDPEEAPRRRAVPRPPERAGAARDDRPSHEAARRSYGRHCDHGRPRRGPAHHRRPHLPQLPRPRTPCRSSRVCPGTRPCRAVASSWAFIAASVRARCSTPGTPRRSFSKGPHAAGHPLPRVPRPPGRPERPRASGRELRSPRRPGPRRPGDRPGPAPRLRGTSWTAVPPRRV